MERTAQLSDTERKELFAETANIKSISSDREIFKPNENKYWPKQENFDHHRREVYRKA